MAFPELSDLVDRVVELLKPIKETRNLTPRSFPDETETDSLPISGLGVVLVGLPNASAPTPNNIKFGKQIQQVEFLIETIVVHRNSGGGHKKLDYNYCLRSCTRVINLLAGKSPGLEDTNWGLFYFKEYSYVGITEGDECWVSSLIFGITYSLASGDCCGI